MNSLEYVREVVGEGFVNWIRVLVEDGLTPHMVGHKVHETLRVNYGWDAPPLFVRAVGEVAEDMIRKGGKR